MDIFTIRLNKLIKENKITKYKLAKDLNICKQSVLYWCEGTVEPGISYLKQLAIYFDVSADYLLGLEDETGSRVEIKNSFNNNQNCSGNNFKF